MSKVTAVSVDSSTATSARGTRDCVVEVVMSSSVSLMSRRERGESSAFGKGSKEVIDVDVPVECRGCSSGGGHSLRRGSGGRFFF